MTVNLIKSKPVSSALRWFGETKVGKRLVAVEEKRRSVDKAEMLLKYAGLTNHGLSSVTGTKRVNDLIDEYNEIRYPWQEKMDYIRNPYEDTVIEKYC